MSDRPIQIQANQGCIRSEHRAVLEAEAVGAGLHLPASLLIGPEQPNRIELKHRLAVRSEYQPELLWYEA